MLTMASASAISSVKKTLLSKSLSTSITQAVTPLLERYVVLPPDDRTAQDIDRLQAALSEELTKYYRAKTSAAPPVSGGGPVDMPGYIGANCGGRFPVFLNRDDHGLVKRREKLPGVKAVSYPGPEVQLCDTTPIESPLAGQAKNY